MSLEFLAPDAAVASDRHTPLARTPMERAARSAGAASRSATAGTSRSATARPSVNARPSARPPAGPTSRTSASSSCTPRAPTTSTAIVASAADGATLELCSATRAADAWWLPLTAGRALVVADPRRSPALRERLQEAASAAPATVSVVDATCKYAALTLVGPLAREVFARFSAVDLRPQVLPVQGFRAGSVARTPGMVVREGEDRFLVAVRLGGRARTCGRR